MTALPLLLVLLVALALGSGTSETQAAREHSCSTLKQPSGGSAVDLPGSRHCGCPDNFLSCAGHCYHLLTTRLNQTEAAATCRHLGAHLAVPRSAHEATCVAGLAGPANAWLGVTDGDQEGQYWGDDGLGAIKEAFWAPDQPDNSYWLGLEPAGEDCVHMMREPERFGQWNDWPCSQPNLAVCQRAAAEHV